MSMHQLYAELLQKELTLNILSDDRSHSQERRRITLGRHAIVAHKPRTLVPLTLDRSEMESAYEWRSPLLGYKIPRIRLGSDTGTSKIVSCRVEKLEIKVATIALA
jgi:hypothetical protein